MYANLFPFQLHSPILGFFGERLLLVVGFNVSGLTRVRTHIFLPVPVAKTMPEGRITIFNGELMRRNNPILNKVRVGDPQFVRTNEY